MLKSLVVVQASLHFFVWTQARYYVPIDRSMCFGMHIILQRQWIISLHLNFLTVIPDLFIPSMYANCTSTNMLDGHSPIVHPINLRSIMCSCGVHYILYLMYCIIYLLYGWNLTLTFGFHYKNYIYYQGSSRNKLFWHRTWFREQKLAIR